MPVFLCNSENFSSNPETTGIYALNASRKDFMGPTLPHIIWEDNMAPIIEPNDRYILSNGMLICTRGNENHTVPQFRYTPAHSGFNQNRYLNWRNKRNKWTPPQPIIISAKPVSRPESPVRIFATLALNNHFVMRNIYYVHETTGQPTFLPFDSWAYSLEKTGWEPTFAEHDGQPRSIPRYKGTSQPPAALIDAKKLETFYARHIHKLPQHLEKRARKLMLASA